MQTWDMGRGPETPRKDSLTSWKFYKSLNVPVHFLVLTGVILAARESWPPVFGVGGKTTHFTSKPSQKFCLVPHFSDQSYATACSYLLPMPTAVAGGGGKDFTAVRLCAPHDISKTDAARINLTQKRSTMSPENPVILESKGQRSRSQVAKTLPAWVFALLWELASSSWLFVVTYWRVLL